LCIQLVYTSLGSIIHSFLLLGIFYPGELGFVSQRCAWEAMTEIAYTHTHSPPHWQEEVTFQEVLAEQLRRAPYLVASMFLHAIVAFALAGIMLLKSEESVTPTIQMVAAPPQPLIEDDPVKPEDDTVEAIVDEPELLTTDVIETTDDVPVEIVGDPDFTSDAALDNSSWNNALGIGDGGGGKYGQRGGGGTRGKTGSPTNVAVLAGLQWLSDHQSADGFWDCDDFMYEDKYMDKPSSDGAGDSTNDVGVSGLALLAFLGNGNTTSKGPYKDNVASGVNWLLDVQDLTTGLIGEEVGNPTLYNHSIAAMALGEACVMGKSVMLRRKLRKSTNLILNAQNPYQAWRYSLEPDGANDSSITGWMVFALKTAEDAKVSVPNSAYHGAKEWFNAMTDKGTGRTGYAFGNGGGPGGPPSRLKIYLERFPPEKSEALTAVALLSQIFMTDSKKVKTWRDHENYDLMRKQADLLANKLPVWDDEGGSCDMYYWYYGTFAMNQWGGKHWKSWKKAIERALLPNQRQGKDNFSGSWDPIGPWGDDGGRVYSTAICTLIMEVYFRYTRILGAR
jgi:hypothetical protein